MAKGYIHTFTRQEQERLLHQAEYLLPWIHQHIDLSACRNVLEIGCGVGAQLKILAKRFPDTHFTGIDSSSEQIGLAEVLLADEIERKQISLIQGSAEELPFSEASFDAVVIYWVLEHLEHPATALGEATRVLKENGLLLATEVFNAGVYCDPPRTALMDYWSEFNSLQKEFGGHPDIGIQLANLALECGLRDVELINVSPHLDNRLTAAERKEMADYFCAIFSSGAEELLKANRVSPELVAGMRADFDHIASDPKSVMVYTAFQLQAVRKAR